MSGRLSNKTAKTSLSQRKKVVCNLECGTPKVQVHLIDRFIDENTQVISGYLTNAETGKRLPGVKDHTHRYNPHISHPATERQNFANRLGATHQKKKIDLKAKQSKTSLADGLVSQAYKKFLELEGCDMNSDLRFSILYNLRWRKSMRKKITYFERNLLPELDRLLNENGTITQTDVDDILELLIERALDKKKSTGQYVVVRKSVEQEVAAALMIYNEVRINVPEYELPELHFQATPQKKTPGNEQVKCLSDPIRIKLAALLLYRLLPIGPACGLALMLFGGLRTAEASAPCFKDIAICGDYAICKVHSQIRGRTKDSLLKTDAAYRTVILPFVFVEFYRQAVLHLKELGCSEDDIQEMPFVTDGVSLSEYLNPNNLSEYIRELLLICGCTKEFLEGQCFLMERYPDRINDNLTNRDVSAYILRRDYATRLSTRCGMPMDALDYLLGHCQKENAGRDFESPDAQAEIAAAIEHFVFLPEFSKNPAYEPIVVSENNLIPPPEPYNEIALNFESENSENFFFSLRTCESDGAIEIHFPKGTPIKEVSQGLEIRYIKDTHRKRKPRPIIVAGTADIPRAIEEVYFLDLTSIKNIKERKDHE